MWFWVWTLLVVGTLVGAVLVARRLWHSAVGLGRELARAGEVAARLAERADELREIAERERVPTQASVLAPVEPLREQVARLRGERSARRARRQERLAEVARGWRAYWT